MYNRLLKIQTIIKNYNSNWLIFKKKKLQMMQSVLQVFLPYNLSGHLANRELP